MLIRNVFLNARVLTPIIHVRDAMGSHHLIFHLHDEDHFGKWCGDGYTIGDGSRENPYTYAGAASVSPYYVLVDLWQRFRPTEPGQKTIYIKANEWVFTLHPKGVVRGGKLHRFTDSHLEEPEAPQQPRNLSLEDRHMRP